MKRLTVAAVLAATVAGCSGKTESATTIGTSSATLQASGQCSQNPDPCYYYFRYGTAGGALDMTTPVRGPIGPTGRVRFSATVSGLSADSAYEFQICGKGDALSSYLCVGPDGAPSSRSRFWTMGADWPTLKDRFGAYHGWANPQGALVFDRWLGRRAAFVHDFFSSENWSRYADDSGQLERGWFTVAGMKERLILSVNPLATDGGGGQATTLRAAAAGDYDSHYLALGRQLAAKGLGGVPLRIGWEFNLQPAPGTDGITANYSAGQSTDGPQLFAKTFRNMVRQMRAGGWTGKSIWCFMVNTGWSDVLGGRIPVAPAYPGDGYVDVIATDLYARSDPNHLWPTVSQIWDGLYYTDFAGSNLNFLANFSKAGAIRPNNDGSDQVGPGHEQAGTRKPIGLSEWGVFRLPWGGPGGGPEPTGYRDAADTREFIDRTVHWLTTTIGINNLDHILYYDNGATPTQLGTYLREYNQHWAPAIREYFGA